MHIDSGAIIAIGPKEVTSAFKMKDRSYPRKAMGAPRLTEQRQEKRGEEDRGARGLMRGSKLEDLGR